jgi:hypothetical protein
MLMGRVNGIRESGIEASINGVHSRKCGDLSDYPLNPLLATLCKQTTLMQPQCYATTVARTARHGGRLHHPRPYPHSAVHH